MTWLKYMYHFIYCDPYEGNEYMRLDNMNALTALLLCDHILDKQIAQVVFSLQWKLEEFFWQEPRGLQVF